MNRVGARSPPPPPQTPPVRLEATRDDFDHVLASSATRRIPLTFDESRLGRDSSPTASPSMSRANSSNQLSPSSWASTTNSRRRGSKSSTHSSVVDDPSTLPRLPGLGLNGLLESASPGSDSGRSEQRRSVVRSVGTASHPDLATLVRSAKEKARRERLLAGHAEDSPTRKDSVDVGDRPRERRRTETARRPIPAFDLESGTGARQSSSITSDLGVSLSIDNEVMLRTDPTGKQDTTPRIRTSIRAVDNDAYVDVAGGGSSWSNTMRKTSGFFRRRFGSTARPPNSLMNPNSPRSIASLPPVPLIPASFRQPSDITEREINISSSPSPPATSSTTTVSYSSAQTRRPSIASDVGKGPASLMSETSDSLPGGFTPTKSPGPSPPMRRSSVVTTSSVLGGLSPAPRRAPPVQKASTSGHTSPSSKALPPSPDPDPDEYNTDTVANRLSDATLGRTDWKGKGREPGSEEHSRTPSLAQLSEASVSTTEEDRLAREISAWGQGQAVYGSASDLPSGLAVSPKYNNDFKTALTPITTMMTVPQSPPLSSNSEGVSIASGPLSTPTFGQQRLPHIMTSDLTKGQAASQPPTARDFPQTPSTIGPSRREDDDEDQDQDHDSDSSEPALDLDHPSIRLVPSRPSSEALSPPLATTAISEDGCSTNPPPAQRHPSIGLGLDIEDAMLNGSSRPSSAPPSPRGSASSPPPTLSTGSVAATSQPMSSSPSVVVSGPIEGEGQSNWIKRLSPPIPMSRSPALGQRNSVVQYPSKMGPSTILPWMQPSVMNPPNGIDGSRNFATVGSGPTPRPTSGRRRLSTQSSFDREEVEGSATDASSNGMEENAKAMATKFWDEDESTMKRDKVSEWLGSTKPLNQLTLRHYMDIYDFDGMRIDIAFRKLCEKLYIKGETQQVDRILEQFSRRFWEQNQSNVYITQDLVHALSYSLLLLNTDLHVVDITTRMTRTQFVRNTMDTVQAQVEASPDASRQTLEVYEPGLVARMSTDNLPPSRLSLDKWREHLPKPSSLQKTRRSGSIASWRSATNRGTASSPDLVAGNGPERSMSIDDAAMRPAQIVLDRASEHEIESLLKDIYTAIKSQPIFQCSTSAETRSLSMSSPYGTLGGIQRAGSRRSHNSVPGSERNASSKRASVRGFGGLLAAASSDSFRSSSPTPSATTSMTGTYSSNTMGSHPYTSMTSPSIGFASSLSHSIIREQQEDEASESGHSTSDEELALLGAPWAKEGILQRKHYWESKGKRAKDKAWTQIFAVIQRGEVKMFKFGDGPGLATSAGMGGGNWMMNAHDMGEIALTHVLVSAMPSGYNRDRPHVFVVSLPDGNSYFFQTGTADLVNEWVSTCNYWAARASKEPMTGGVSNIEYGWSRVGGETEDGSEREELASVMSGFSGHSFRSRRSKMSFQSAAASNPNDRLVITEWKAPQASSHPSTHGEETQLTNLKRHTERLQIELEQHNGLRTPMSKLFSPKSVNAQKAMGNWERKSQYLLSDIVKYTTYIESLESAGKLREQRRDEKQINKLLTAADESEIDVDSGIFYPDASKRRLSEPAPPSSMNGRGSGMTISQAGVRSRLEMTPRVRQDSGGRVDYSSHTVTSKQNTSEGSVTFSDTEGGGSQAALRRSSSPSHSVL